MPSLSNYFQSLNIHFIRIYRDCFYRRETFVSQELVGICLNGEKSVWRNSIKCRISVLRTFYPYFCKQENGSLDFGKIRYGKQKKYRNTEKIRKTEIQFFITLTPGKKLWCHNVYRHAESKLFGVVVVVAPLLLSQQLQVSIYKLNSYFRRFHVPQEKLKRHNNF